MIPFGVAESWSRRIQVNNDAIANINEVNFEANFDMYPNPANENFSIHFNNGNNEEGSVEIYNELGLLTKRVDLGNESVIKANISVSDFKPGVYFVKTTIGDRTSSRKLIIQ
ncbi:MAG: T9SS type A sorting domain-containing protein [Bacteroidia bacterium]|nr:T9SS type A sorting domain-containing protein [Bacteroidia bacterium]